LLFTVFDELKIYISVARSV